MHLRVSVSHGKGGTGDMFQIDAAQDAGTGKNLTNEVDIGRHFADNEQLAEYLCEEFGDNTSFEIEEES